LLKRKPIGERNGLKIYTRLQTRTQLKANKKINPVTAKQRARNKSWSEVTNKRIEQVENRCEWCGKIGQRTGTLNFLTGHHKLKRRFNDDTIENCYIVHWITCHQFIEHHSVDVNIYHNKTEWEKRDG
jgi:hypothetical protein